MRIPLALALLILLWPQCGARAGVSAGPGGRDEHTHALQPARPHDLVVQSPVRRFPIPEPLTPSFNAADIDEEDSFEVEKAVSSGLHLCVPHGERQGSLGHRTGPGLVPPSAQALPSVLRC